MIIQTGFVQCLKSNNTIDNNIIDVDLDVKHTCTHKHIILSSVMRKLAAQFKVGLLDYVNNNNPFILIILVNIEISIIQTIIFEFENMMHLFIISLQKKHFVNQNLKKYTKWSNRK